VSLGAPLLLDTCAVIWLAEAQPLARPATSAMEEAYDTGTSVFVSPITAWEIGMLNARKRLALKISPQRWYRRLFDVLNFSQTELTADILLNSSYLPGRPPRDPADRILAATAREFGYRLVTRDRPLLEYAGQGHIHALPC
jgi:PIN domain nuclease of toxin-antitoxin system